MVKQRRLPDAWITPQDQHPADPGLCLPEQQVEPLLLCVAAHEHGRTIGHRLSPGNQDNIAGFTEAKDASHGGSFRGDSTNLRRFSCASS